MSSAKENKTGKKSYTRFFSFRQFEILRKKKPLETASKRHFRFLSISGILS